MEKAGSDNLNFIPLNTIPVQVLKYAQKRSLITLVTRPYENNIAYMYIDVSTFEKLFWLWALYEWTCNFELYSNACKM